MIVISRPDVAAAPFAAGGAVGTAPGAAALGAPGAAAGVAGAAGRSAAGAPFPCCAATAGGGGGREFLLPRLPQQHRGEREDHEQDQTLCIHDSLKDRASAHARRARWTEVVVQGTGS